MIQLEALLQFVQKLLLSLELFISIPSLLGVAVAVHIIKTSTKWLRVQRLIGFNYLFSYYLYTLLRLFSILLTLVNDKNTEPFAWIGMLQSGAIYVGAGNCLLLTFDRALSIRWPNISCNYLIGMVILSSSLWVACYSYHLFLYIFKVSDFVMMEMVRELSTPVVAFVIVVLAVFVNRLGLEDVEKRKEGLREMIPEEQAIMRKKLEIHRNIDLVYKPILVRLLVAVVACLVLQIGATSVEIMHLVCSSTVSNLLSNLFYLIVAISPPMILHGTLQHRDNVFLLQRFEGFCDTMNNLALRSKGRSTIYELQPNTNTQPITSVRDELFRQETERQSNHFYTLTHYWQHPNPIPPGTIIIPENGP